MKTKILIAIIVLFYSDMTNGEENAFHLPNKPINYHSERTKQISRISNLIEEYNVNNEEWIREMIREAFLDINHKDGVSFVDTCILKFSPLFHIDDDLFDKLESGTISDEDYYKYLELDTDPCYIEGKVILISNSHYFYEINIKEASERNEHSLENWGKISSHFREFEFQTIIDNHYIDGFKVDSVEYYKQYIRNIKFQNEWDSTRKVLEKRDDLDSAFKASIFYRRLPKDIRNNIYSNEKDTCSYLLSYFPTFCLKFFYSPGGFRYGYYWNVYQHFIFDNNIYDTSLSLMLLRNYNYTMNNDSLLNSYRLDSIVKKQFMDYMHYKKYYK